MRSIYELSTEEAYDIVVQKLGKELPPFKAVENEDWGRDYVLQHFEQCSEAELEDLGLTWCSEWQDEEEEPF